MIEIRLAEERDRQHLVDWLLQPGVLDGFPLYDLREVEDAATIWISYRKFDAVLTATIDSAPCGIANLYIQPYEKLSHHALFAIIVDEKVRGKGVGTKLIEELLKLAKENFKLEFVHLEVYAGNRAINLYRKFGFVEYGVHKRFLKQDGKFVDKILMQKYL